MTTAPTRGTRPTARLENRVAIVTGASSGIGRAIALSYAREGATVVVADLKEFSRNVTENSASTSELITRNGGSSIFCEVDVCNALSVNALVDRAVREYGRVDMYASGVSMVNNAGIAVEIENPNPIWKMPDATWEKTMGVNATGVFHGCRAATAQMIKQEPWPNGDRGWIINMSSTYGQTAIAGSGAYAASKHAVLGLTKAAALDCAPQRIHVNAICPGYTSSAMTAPLFVENPQYQEDIEAVHPFRGLGTPEDLAKIAVVLASDDASWMTGAAIAVDGGYLCQ